MPETAETAEAVENGEHTDERLAELYSQAPNETPSRKGKSKVDIELAMDTFINAAMRPYLRCHR